jgi:hypothetical protein
MFCDVSTEMLIKLRERYSSGRTRFFAFHEGPEVAHAIKEMIIDAIEKELRRRLS